jgi:hypothetical protein
MINNLVINLDRLGNSIDYPAKNDHSKNSGKIGIIKIKGDNGDNKQLKKSA